MPLCTRRHHVYPAASLLLLLAAVTTANPGWRLGDAGQSCSTVCDVLACVSPTWAQQPTTDDLTLLRARNVGDAASTTYTSSADSNMLPFLNTASNMLTVVAEPTVSGVTQECAASDANTRRFCCCSDTDFAPCAAQLDDSDMGLIAGTVNQQPCATTCNLLSLACVQLPNQPGAFNRVIMEDVSGYACTSIASTTSIPTAMTYRFDGSACFYSADDTITIGCDTAVVYNAARLCCCGTVNACMQDVVENLTPSQLTQFGLDDSNDDSNDDDNGGATTWITGARGDSCNSACISAGSTCLEIAGEELPSEASFNAHHTSAFGSACADPIQMTTASYAPSRTESQCFFPSGELSTYSLDCDANEALTWRFCPCAPVDDDDQGGDGGEEEPTAAPIVGSGWKVDASFPTKPCSTVCGSAALTKEARLVTNGNRALELGVLEGLFEVPCITIVEGAILGAAFPSFECQVPRQLGGVTAAPAGHFNICCCLEDGNGDDGATCLAQATAGILLAEGTLDVIDASSGTTTCAEKCNASGYECNHYLQRMLNNSEVFAAAQTTLATYTDQRHPCPSGITAIGTQKSGFFFDPSATTNSGCRVGNPASDDFDGDYMCIVTANTETTSTNQWSQLCCCGGYSACRTQLVPALAPPSPPSPPSPPPSNSAGRADASAWMIGLLAGAVAMVLWL